MNPFETMRQAVEEAVNSFQKFSASVLRVVVSVGKGMQKVTNDNYRARYGKLPGSDRTKRLRKKRVAMVNARMFGADNYVVR